jgi:nucleotide-binding universal stress UspA family protein
VVVGVNFEHDGDDAILMALRMLEQGAASKVHLLHVLDPRDVIDDPESPVLRTEEQVLARAPTILRDRAHQLGAMFGISFDRERLATHARLGGAVDTLRQMTVDYEADLLIVGTHARRGMARILLGSVAEELVRKSHCPVLVARPRNYDGLEKTALPDSPPAPGEPRHHAPPRDVTDHVVSTESDGWRPSQMPPTGYRIV